MSGERRDRCSSAPSAPPGGRTWTIAVYELASVWPWDRLPTVCREHGTGRVAEGGCPPPAPADPHVRNSRIRLLGPWHRYAGAHPRAAVSNDSPLASCRTCVETAAGAVSRTSVRPTAHDPVRRFPPPDPRGAGSPTSPVLSADSDFSPPVPPRFVFLRLAVPPCALFAPAGAGRASGPGLPFIAAAHAASPVETTRPPRFPGDPCPHAPLSDPGGTPDTRPSRRPRWRLPLLSQRRLPR